MIDPLGGTVDPVERLRDKSLVLQHLERERIAAEIERLQELRGLNADLTTVLEKRNAEIERLRACRTELDFAVEYYTHGLRPLDLRDWYTRACAALKDTKP